MKRLVEDFDDMMNIEDEVSVEDTKSPLEKELIRVYEYLKDKGETDIKAYEVAYQEAIEKIYPENSWWEVIDLNIFWDLFENQNPRTTIDNIISSIKPEFKKEVIDTVVTEDIEEENPLKDIRSNIMEFPNGEYVYVEYADGKLYAGSATNRGIIHEYEMDYDKDFDVDRNLQDFFDKIIEENPELGEPLDESKKVCEDTVKQGNKWVNKGKDGTHGTFKTKKAADAQRRAMFANKGKKSTFGESFKVGDTFTNAGEEWEILRSEGDYSLVYAKDRKFYPYVVAYRLADDGTWAQGHYFSNKDSAEKFLMNETGSVNESVRRKKRAIKESDDDFVIFEQEPDDFIDVEWFFDDDSIEYYIDGGRDFGDVNKDFLNEYVDNEAIHKAFDDIDDDDEFYTVKDIFDYFDGDDITSALSAGLGEEYGSAVLRGYSQGDWVTIYYPKREYSRKDIRIIEDYYFGNVTGWYNDDYGEVILTETELESYYGDPTKIIKKLISDATGAPVDKIKLRRFKGYHQVADYIDESKQRRRSNRCVTEAKKEKLSKKTKAKRIYESMKKKRDRLKESRLSDDSSTNIKDSPSEGYIYTYCDECGKKNRVKVTFNSFKEPFNDTEYTCKYCGTHNMLTDPHSYDEDGRVIESSQSYLDRIEELMNQGLDEETASREAYAEFHPDEYDADDYDEGYESIKRKPKKNLKEAADDEIKLFMNTWANYNENGADDGITPTGWMSLDEAEEYAEKYAEYEPFINDTDNVPKELGVDEYSNIPETVDMLRKYEDFDDTQREVFAAFIDDGYEVDEAFDIVDDDDYFYIEGDSDTDLAYNYIDEIGGIENLDRDTLERYFDYDGFGRDLAFDFIETENGYVSH